VAVNPFCNSIIDLCTQSCNVGQKLKSGDIPWESASSFKTDFISQLNNICKKPLNFKPAETLRSYLYGPHQKFLFTFLEQRGVPQQTIMQNSLQALVIFRKICFGIDRIAAKNSQRSAQFGSNARRQNVNPSNSCKFYYCRHGNFSSRLVQQFILTSKSPLL